MDDIQNPQEQTQYQPQQQYQQQQYQQQQYQQQQYQQQQYQQPQYQQPYGGPMGYAPRPAVNIWESIAKWDFKTMSYVAVGVFFLSIFVVGLSSDRTTILLFRFFAISCVILASFLCYSKAEPKMEEGNNVGWPLLIGGIVVVLLQFILTFIKTEDWQTIKTLDTIIHVAMAVSAFSLLYAFFKVRVFDHSYPALLLGIAFVLALMGHLIDDDESFGRLCTEFSSYAMVSSLLVLLGEVVYNRSLNQG